MRESQIDFARFPSGRALGFGYPENLTPPLPSVRKGVPMSFGPTELIIVLFIVLLVFGSTKLPKLARSMGEASKEFKKGVDDTTQQSA